MYWSVAGEPSPASLQSGPQRKGTCQSHHPGVERTSRALWSGLGHFGAWWGNGRKRASGHQPWFSSMVNATAREDKILPTLSSFWCTSCPRKCLCLLFCSWVPSFSRRISQERFVHSPKPRREELLGLDSDRQFIPESSCPPKQQDLKKKN